ncbi:hypothetical protein HGB13_02830 [bacterium]|nr:hypothetical protein [bacterium]
MAKKNKVVIKEKKHWIKISLFVFAGIVFAGIVFILANYLYFDINYKNKFFRNTNIIGIDLSGKTKEDAEELLTVRMQEWNETNLLVNDKEKSWEFSKTDLVINFDLEGTINEAYLKGRDGNYIIESINRVKRLFVAEESLIKYVVSNDSIKNVKEVIAKDAELQAINTGLVVKDGEIQETEESVGKKIREKDFFNNIKNEISNLTKNNIKLTYYYVFPNSDKDSLEKIKEEASNMLAQSITLSYKEKKWLIDPPLISKWITIDSSLNKKEDETLMYKSALEYMGRIWDKDDIVSFVNNSNNISLDNEKVSVYLNDIGNQIDIKAKNAVLNFTDGKLIVTEGAKKGIELDRENAKFLILSALKNKTKNVDLSVKESIAQVREDNLDELGITELISQGKSDFTGSTPARINNVKVGASKFNGLLIAPGEEFSFVKYLGEVDAAAGFLPELVIKPGKLIKEYGGGLCQVATTSFRAALYAGLPITERKNHSYVVHYYFWPFSGPGTDATIYGPHPDLRFKNDTGYYILIQTYSQGNRLFFDYYGTKGNRSATIDGPYTLSSNPDGSATTVFYRNVFENSILKRRDTFNSYYKPAAEFKREE